MSCIRKKRRQQTSILKNVVHEIGRKYHVTVATSDNVEQVVTLDKVESCYLPGSFGRRWKKCSAR